jgi:hypothetical protein
VRRIAPLLCDRPEGRDQRVELRRRTDPRGEAIERSGLAGDGQNRVFEHSPKVALGVAEIGVERLERQPEDGAAIGESARREMKKKMRLAGAVGPREDREDRPLHRRVLEELVDRRVDVLVSDAHRQNRFDGREPLR